MLLAPGPGGRVRVGSARSCHVRVPNLDLELDLERAGAELLLSSPAFVAESPFAGEAGSQVLSEQVIGRRSRTRHERVNAEKVLTDALNAHGS